MPLPADGNNKPQFRFQFTFLAGRYLKSITTLDIPQFLNYGDVYKIKSAQLQNWTAEIAADKSRGDIAIKILIKRGEQLILELPLSALVISAKDQISTQTKY